VSDVLEAKQEYLQLLQEREYRAKYNKIDYVFPDTGDYRRELFPYATKFFTATKEFKEVCMLAPNRSGKTFSAACLTTWHLTGEYPDWYEGRRFDEPVYIIVFGVTATATRDSIQKLLFGPPGDPDALGTGLIPRDKIVGKPKTKAGIPGGIDFGFVEHSSGGNSTILFMAYDQTLNPIMGKEAHVVWLDEECPDPMIYTEALTRTATTRGNLIMTFTPLRGFSKVVMQYLPEGYFPQDGIVRNSDGYRTGKYVVNYSWDDVPESVLAGAEKKSLLLAYSEVERDARTKGIPTSGSGSIYPVKWSDVIVDPFEIEPWYECAMGLDTGWVCTAGIWGAKHPDTGVTYIYAEHYKHKMTPEQHYECFKEIGAWVKCAIDPSTVRHNDQGVSTMNQYYELGLDVFPASNAIDAGIARVLMMFNQGKLKIFSSCVNLLKELYTYRYGS
jgi:phage terminase large subunit-like protein